VQSSRQTGSPGFARIAKPLRSDKMKNHLCAWLGILVLLFFTACSSNPTVKRVDADTQIDLSGRWNDTDVRIVCETLISKALSSDRIDKYINDYSLKNKGAYPTVIVGAIRNTSDEHIDTGLIANLMRTAIIKSGKLDFVEGGEAREGIRTERQDQQVNASEASAAALGNETGADFMLTGVVNSVVDRAGNTSTRSYFVRATITDVETNRILWEDEDNSIKKVIQQPKTKF
jgi:uncharacterized protein (TIGR02722 family)